MLFVIMGIDYSSKLIFGWQVDIIKVLQYLIDKNVGSCNCEKTPTNIKEQCLCGPKYCWDQTKLPTGLYIVHTYSHYDCGILNANCYISLIENEYEISYSKIKNFNDEHIENIKKIAIELGAYDEEPKFMSAVHIS